MINTFQSILTNMRDMLRTKIVVERQENSNESIVSIVNLSGNVTTTDLTFYMRYPEVVVEGRRDTLTNRSYTYYSDGFGARKSPESLKFEKEQEQWANGEWAMADIFEEIEANERQREKIFSVKQFRNMYGGRWV